MAGICHYAWLSLGFSEKKQKISKLAIKQLGKGKAFIAQGILCAKFLSCARLSCLQTPTADMKTPVGSVGGQASGWRRRHGQALGQALAGFQMEWETALVCTGT